MLMLFLVCYKISFDSQVGWRWVKVRKDLLYFTYNFTHRKQICGHLLTCLSILLPTNNSFQLTNHTTAIWPTDWLQRTTWLYKMACYRVAETLAVKKTLHKSTQTLTWYKSANSNPKSNFQACTPRNAENTERTIRKEIPPRAFRSVGICKHLFRSCPQLTRCSHTTLRFSFEFFIAFFCTMYL